MEPHREPLCHVRNLRRARHSGASVRLGNSDGPLGHCSHVRLTGLSGPLPHTRSVRSPWLDSPSLCKRLREERL